MWLWSSQLLVFLKSRTLECVGHTTRMRQQPPESLLSARILVAFNSSGYAPQRHSVLCRHKNRLVVFVETSENLRVLPLSQNIADVIIQGQEAFVDALQGGDGGDELCG